MPDQTGDTASASSFLSRRRVVQAGAAGVALLASDHLVSVAHESATPVASSNEPAEIPITGEAAPQLDDFDTIMTEVMATWALPGGQLAIAHEGRLVFNRGYGYADVDAQEPVEPDALFRIASTSKPITAVAILRLVDDGKLRLDEPVFPLLALEPAPNATRDPRLDTITVEHLLVHAGGWDTTVSFDPQYLPWPLMASHTLGEPDPAEGETIIRYMLGVPLDFDPGTRSVYSNFGFNVLGRVIEHVTGQSYEHYVIENVLKPAGITDMQLGGTRETERAPGEVRYYGPAGQALRESVFPGEGYVPVGYGSYYMPALDAHGGWIASAADLVRFALAVDGAHGEAILSPDAVQVMEVTPRPASGEAGAGNEASKYGLGWNVAPADGGSEWSHAGALEGSNCSWLLRLPNGAAIGFVFNTLPEDFGAFFGDIITKLRAAFATTDTWPENDLFA